MNMEKLDLVLMHPKTRLFRSKKGAYIKFNKCRWYIKELTSFDDMIKKYPNENLKSLITYVKGGDAVE